MAAVNALVIGAGSIKGGRLFIRNRAAFDEGVSTLKDGCEVEIAVTLLRATRSIQRNRWYWGVCVALLSEHTGYSADEIHDILKAKFIPKSLAVLDGNGTVVDAFVIGGSTRQMSVPEFERYCTDIQQWAAEKLAVDIPDPDPCYAERVRRYGEEELERAAAEALERLHG